jgi:hypothetical protein
VLGIDSLLASAEAGLGAAAFEFGNDFFHGGETYAGRRSFMPDGGGLAIGKRD